MDMNTDSAKSDPAGPATDRLAPIQEMLRACIQCGTCSASCPNEFAMDRTPRLLWQMVLMGQTAEIFKTRTFAMCSTCYYCTLRCPRGLPLTEVMNALKRIAARDNNPRYRQSTLFYKKFIHSVRRHGRVSEMEFMALYFAALKKPLAPLRLVPLGIKLMGKGKVAMSPPVRAQRPLESIFRKIEALEASS